MSVLDGSCHVSRTGVQVDAVCNPSWCHHGCLPCSCCRATCHSMTRATQTRPRCQVRTSPPCHD